MVVARTVDTVEDSGGARARSRSALARAVVADAESVTGWRKMMPVRDLPAVVRAEILSSVC